MTQIQKSDPIFNTGVEVKKPEPKYRVTMLTREEWPVCFTDGSRTAEGTKAGIYWQSANRRLSISPGEHATVFQAEVYAVLACVHEIETQDRPEKYVSI